MMGMVFLFFAGFFLFYRNGSFRLGFSLHLNFCILGSLCVLVLVYPFSVALEMFFHEFGVVFEQKIYSCVQSSDRIVESKPKIATELVAGLVLGEEKRRSFFFSQIHLINIAFFRQ